MNTRNFQNDGYLYQSNRIEEGLGTDDIIQWYSAFSALTLLVGQQEGHPAWKSWVVGCWCGYLSGWGADLHMAQLIPLRLTISWFNEIQIGFTFLVLADLGNPGQNPESRKMVVCVCVYSTISWSSMDMFQEKMRGVKMHGLQNGRCHTKPRERSWGKTVGPKN